MILAANPDVYMACPTLPEVRAHFRGLTTDFVNGPLQVVTNPPGEGRGIVTCGGGAKFR